MGTYPQFLDLDVLFFYHIEKAFKVIVIEENVDRDTSDWGIHHFFEDVYIGENIHSDCYDLYRHKNENIIETSTSEDFWVFTIRTGRLWYSLKSMTSLSVTQSWTKQRCEPEVSAKKHLQFIKTAPAVFLRIQKSHSITWKTLFMKPTGDAMYFLWPFA